MSAPTVAVIGAGIVGVSTAAWLQRAGHAVTLIDAGGVGEGASFGNAGNLSPGGVVPHVIPGILAEAPRWLLDPQGPLTIRPGYFFKVLPWLRAAVKASSTEAALQTSRGMHALHAGVFEAYDALTRGTDAGGLIERGGQLYVSRHAGKANGSALAQAMREAAGVETQVLGEQDIRDLEPALAPGFVSGLLLPGNGRCRNPHELVLGIAREAQRAGTQVRRGRVTGFHVEADRVQAVVIDGEAERYDQVVIAAGARSGELTALLGLPLPLEAERGYHVVLEDPGVMPRRPVSHLDAKFIAAPMDMGLRLAGTVEFAGLDAPPDWKRAALLKKQAERMFPGVRVDRFTRWCGNRPSLPDGLPVLGRAPRHANVCLAFGNAHFGMTAGPVMGKLAAEIVAGRAPSIDLSPFRPERFADG